jgi:hypothetical protein
MLLYLVNLLSAKALAKGNLGHKLVNWDKGSDAMEEKFSSRWE